VTPTPPPAKRARRLFRVEVGTLVVGVVLAQALLLLSLGYWGSKRLLYSVGHAAHEEEHARLETEVKAFIGAATGAVRALAASPGQQLSGTGEQRSAELIWSLMSESGALDHLYFAHHDGMLVGVQRHPVPALRRIHPAGAVTHEVLEFKPGLEQLALQPAQRYLTSRTERNATAYDVRSQPWFIAALKAGSPHWEQVHRLPFSGELGVTFAAPDGLVDARGALDGVAAGDISLRHLEKLVETFSHAGAGESAILTADGRVLARSDDERPPTALASPPAGDILHTVLPPLAIRPIDAQPVEFGGEVYLIRSTPIPGTPWKLVSWLPEEVVVGGLHRGLRLAGLVLALCLGSALLLSLWLSRRVTQPVEVLAGVARRIGRLDLEALPRVDSPVDEIHRLDEALGESARSLRVLRKFVPADTVDALVRQGRPLEPGGQQLELTVMFTDIEGFTGIAAAVPPERLVPQLTDYFNAAAAVVVRHGGTIDKYIGDGMMVLWGAPTPLDDAAWRACTAAVELQETLEACNVDWEARGLPRLHTRIGLHSGPAVAGVLGSSERLSFTAFGDTVNLASRIEAMNKELGTRILASEQTVAALGGRLALRARGDVELRGRAGRWTLYEVLGKAP
jgi:adenylate cyclase